MKLVIFTDLDGSLLSTGDFQFKAAMTALNLIKDRRIPLVFVSSKTSAEIKYYQGLMGVECPFVCENGAAVYIPAGYFKGVSFDRTDFSGVFIEMGPTASEIQTLYQLLKNKFPGQIKYLCESQIEEVIEDTGLSHELSSLTRNRQYDCPIQLEKPNEKLIAEIAELALRCGFKMVAGSRYYHFLKGNDKGKAVKLLIDLYEKKAGEAILSAAVGDSPNDSSMLEIVDYPILVQKNNREFDERINFDNLHRIKQVGPLGWNEGVLELLDRFTELPVILASQSPRRADLLKKAGINFEVIVSEIKEDNHIGVTPVQTAEHLAELKAQNVALRHPNRWVIGADTIVVLNNEIFGKPHDKKSALAMLERLNNQRHEVITGVCLINKERKTSHTFSEKSVVVFKNNSREQLESYVETGECLDKAGAYAIQGKGAELIDHFEGDLNNIIGFPTGSVKFQTILTTIRRA